MPTHNYRVRAGWHDAASTLSPALVWSYSATSAALDSGHSVLMQFSVCVPAGSTIQSADMTVFPTASKTGTISGTAQALAAADYSKDLKTTWVDAVQLGTANWTTTAWSASGVVIDIATLVTTFIERTAYQPGDLMTIQVNDADGTPGRALYSFDHSSATAATLAVEYTAPSGIDWPSDVLTMIADFGERLVYVPVVGAERQINGIVDRLEPGNMEGFDGVSVVPITVVVANDQESGVASWEVADGDKVRVAGRLGIPATNRLIGSVRVQDSGMLELSLS